MIFDSGDRVYHLSHVRNRKDLKLAAIRHNGHRYLFNMDRAYRVKWAPWIELNRHVLAELVRSKKIGLLLYQEPCKRDCAECKARGDKRYIDVYPNCYPGIEPMHISRVHQPSGEMRG